MNANPDLLEKVEYLRDKADIGYEEALTLLERFDGDMTRILIELERSNRLKGEPETIFTAERTERAQDNVFTHERGDTRHHHYKDKHHITFMKVVNMLLHNRLKITRDSHVIVDLPVICYLVFVLFAPHLSIFALIALFMFGCRLSRVKSPGTIRQEDVTEFVGKTAQNIRTTFDSVAKTIHKAPRQDSPSEQDEGGEYTVE